MEYFCVYCQKKNDKQDSICSECKNRLIKYVGIETCDIEVFHKNGTEGLYYHLCKIDEYFQSEICLDYSSPKMTEKELLFHRRRIKCLNKCINQIDPSTYSLKTKDEILSYQEVVNKFWNKQISEKQRDKFIEEFRADKLYISSDFNEIQTLLLNIMSEKESLDWSWWQYMEIHFMDLTKFMNNENILKIIREDFAGEIRYPIEIKKPKY
ncbi:hypothetical protein [Tenacibaculum sp. nBUS_03]|uniref:hypothetical protein n=1 Tax=Tenacibaculum sp. nBUS_03 TaxID=3395320 RepID=UPI003EBD2F95